MDTRFQTEFVRGRPSPWMSHRRPKSIDCPSTAEPRQGPTIPWPQSSPMAPSPQAGAGPSARDSSRSPSSALETHFFGEGSPTEKSWKPYSNLSGAGLWVYSHFCDTRGSPPVYGVLVFGKPFLLYHRSGHFPQPCSGGPSRSVCFCFFLNHRWSLRSRRGNLDVIRCLLQTPGRGSPNRVGSPNFPVRPSLLQVILATRKAADGHMFRRRGRVRTMR